MNAENIFGFAIYALVALFMMGIGIVQIKSRKPVAFYSGEKPPKAEELTDVSAWNRKHGMMWLAYGIIILISFLIISPNNFHILVMCKISIFIQNEASSKSNFNTIIFQERCCYINHIINCYILQNINNN